MANLRSYTGFLTLDAVGAETISIGNTFDYPAADPLGVIIQDADAQLDGDQATDEQSSDAEGDQIGFIANSSGDVLLDGGQIYVESSFTFTLDGGRSFTGYLVEAEGSSQSYLLLPTGLSAGEIEITAIDESVANVAYANAGESGGELIDQNAFTDLNLTGADVIDAGAGNDTIDAGAGDDTVFGGDGNDVIVGNAGGETIFGGEGADDIRGDSGEQAVSVVREGLQWADFGLANDAEFVQQTGGFDQNTSNMNVNFNFTELARFSLIDYRNNANQFTDGIETDGSAIGNDVAYLEGVGGGTPGETMQVVFTFTANDPTAFENEVRNVQFRINDIDNRTWRDELDIRAFDANGDPVHINLSGGDRMVLIDTDGQNGFDRVEAIDGLADIAPSSPLGSLFVEIPGPVARIEIDYGNLETVLQRVDVTDIYFDAVPVAIANTATGADSLLGEAGDDTIRGEGGDDTIDGGLDADSVLGGDGDDLILLNDDFGDDTIDGGQNGETSGDTLDGGALTQAVDVAYTGDEAADVTRGPDNASFTDIEHLNTGSGDDTIDGTLDTVGIDLDAGAGTDTILGGAAADTLNAGEGADTIDGQGGADTVNAGGGDDVIELTNGFGDDSIVAGESGETNGDMLDGSALTQSVTVTFSADEDGAVDNGVGDIAGFEEVEAVVTGSGGDTIDASASTGGVDVTTNAGGDTILGGSVGDVIDAGADNDTIDGGLGGDTIDGGANNDSIDGGQGADSIDGGSGADSILGGAGADTIITDNGTDTIDGGADADVIEGGNGFDLINLTGVFGNDTITGGEGVNDGDTVDGGALSENIVVTATGVEAGTFAGQTSGSTATFSEIEAIETGSGDDTIDGTLDTGGIEVVTNDGADSIIGGAGADSVSAGGGDDVVSVADGFGDDSLAGGETGETAGDLLDGAGLTESVGLSFSGDEAGSLTNATDTATFAEFERFATGAGADTIDAAASTGGVTVDAGAGADTITGGDGADTLTAGAGADTVDGGQGADNVSGGGGDDELRLSDDFGDDTIFGGETDETGGDTLAGGGLTQAVTVTFSADETGDVVNGDGDTAAFSEIEAVQTGSGDDTITAAASTGGVNVDAGGGADDITGGDGADTLAAGGGDDTVSGGLGADDIAAGDGDDLVLLTDGFGDDTVVGGEGGETSGDTLSGAAITENLVVDYSGDEAGDLTGQTSGDVVSFSEIEAINTGSGDDTINAANDSLGVTINSGAGADSATGGSGDDDLATEAGADTVDGGAGADTISTGDGDDVVRLSDGFGADSITAGEGAETNGDALDGSGLSENATVTFNADGESGTVSNAADTATFAEIETLATGSGDDVIDGSAATSALLVDAGAGADSVTGGSGGDTIAADDGADTVDGGAGADNVTGGGGDDLLRISDNFGADTIVGGETDETSGDTLDGGALTQSVEVIFSGDEAGAVDNTVDVAGFSEIEAVATGAGDDTINAAAKAARSTATLSTAPP